MALAVANAAAQLKIAIDIPELLVLDRTGFAVFDAALVYPHKNETVRSASQEIQEHAHPVATIRRGNHEPSD